MSKPNSETYRGMVNLSEMFRQKKKIYSGLTKEEVLSLFYKIDISKIKKMNPHKIELMWEKISIIKKYLIKTKQMAIIFEPVTKETTLKCEEYGERTLDRRRNIFYRCIKEEESWKYRRMLDRIADGINETGENVVEIVKEEQEQKKAVEVIVNERQKVKREN